MEKNPKIMMELMPPTPGKNRQDRDMDMIEQLLNSPYRNEFKNFKQKNYRSSLHFNNSSGSNGSPDESNVRYSNEFQKGGRSTNNLMMRNSNQFSQSYLTRPATSTNPSRSFLNQTQYSDTTAALKQITDKYNNQRPSSTAVANRRQSNIYLNRKYIDTQNQSNQGLFNISKKRSRQLSAVTSVNHLQSKVSNQLMKIEVNIDRANRNN